MMNTDTTGFIHIAEVRDDAMSGPSLGSHRLDKRPVVMLLFVFVAPGDLLQKHVQIYNIKTALCKRGFLDYMNFCTEINERLLHS